MYARKGGRKKAEATKDNVSKEDATQTFNETKMEMPSHFSSAFYLPNF